MKERNLRQKSLCLSGSLTNRSHISGIVISQPSQLHVDHHINPAMQLSAWILLLKVKMFFYAVRIEEDLTHQPCEDLMQIHTLIVHPCFRFYNRLPEVRKKREEDTRAKVYATNRERAREYQEVHFSLNKLQHGELLPKLTC